MQKKLLSLLFIAGVCSTVHGEDKDQKVPVTSDAEHAQDIKEYDQLKAEVDELEKKINTKKQQLDMIDAKRYSYEQRISFIKGMVVELRNEPGTVAKIVEKNKQSNDQLNQRLKKHDNGISYSCLGGLTEPEKDSRADQEYKRINDLTNNRKTIDEKLSKEHTGYIAITEGTILPRIADYLSDQAATFDNHIRSFERCIDCRNNASEYKKCLEKKRIANISEESIEESEDDIIQDAYNLMKDAHIPVTKENVLMILEMNKVTKGSFLKMRTSKENLRKALKGESLNAKPKLETKTGDNTEEPAPRILPDKQ